MSDFLHGLRPDRERTTLCLLALAALGLLALFALYSFVLPLTPGYLAKPASALIRDLPLWSFFADLEIPWLEQPGTIGASLIAGSSLAFVLYGFGLWLTWGRSSRALVVLVTLASVAFLSLSTLSQPNLTRNIYNYIMRGRLAGVYGENPYTVPVDQIRSDPLYELANPKYTQKSGGKLPAWMVINAGLARVAGDDPTTVLFVYRATFLLATLGVLLMLGVVLARWSPGGLASGLMFWGWNPIVVTYGPSKTDSVMVCYLMGAILLLALGRRRMAAVPLALSVFVKLITLPLVAVAALGEIRRGRWRELAIGGAVTLAVVFALYLPFSGGSSLLVIEHLGLAGTEGGTAGGGMARKLLALGFCALILGVGLRQDGSPQKLVRGWALVALYFSLFIAKFPSADYLMTLIALVSVALEWRLALVTVVVSAAAFIFSVWYQTATPELPLPDVFSLPTWLVYLAPTAVVGAGLLAPAILRALRGRRASTDPISRAHLAGH